MEISVIIPVYNKAPYLADCLESVLEQEFNSFEAVAVDDGSTDESGTILDRFARKYPALRVIHTDNHGVTAARRTAVEASQGRYITFVDADDTLRPHALATLHEAITREDADEVVATSYNIRKGEHVNNALVGYADPQWMIGQLLGWKAKFCVLWAVIFKRELLDGCLNAPREVNAGEDVLMQILCLLKNPKVYFINDSVYNYNAGLPNDRRFTLQRAIATDNVLRKALSISDVGGGKYADLFTLQQIKIYECFIADGQLDVLDRYYRPVRKRLTRAIPLLDRIAICLPPWLARWPIRWWKRRQR